MARWTASAKWGEAPALDGQRDMPLALRLSEGLGRTRDRQQTAEFGIAVHANDLRYDYLIPGEPSLLLCLGLQMLRVLHELLQCFKRFPVVNI